MYGRDYSSSNRSYGSLRHSSGPLSGYTRPSDYRSSMARTPSTYVDTKAEVLVPGKVKERYLRNVEPPTRELTKPAPRDVAARDHEFKVMTSRGSSTQDSGNFRNQQYGVSAVASFKVERLPKKSRVLDNATQTMDDIFLPTPTSPSGHDNFKRPNIGGRYMQQISTESKRETAPTRS